MAENLEDEATQPATQEVLDPRRLGRNNSGLTATDVADVLCILHPASPAAFRIAAATAQLKPEHVLQSGTIETFEDGAPLDELEEQDTFVINSDPTNTGQDLALRFSSRTVQPVLGFCFGRNPMTCDIVLDQDSMRRVSNLHFRIFINTSGVLMLEDMSTNGTLVDETHLKRLTSPVPATRMLQGGAIIQIPAGRADELVKFIVRIPSRTGYYEQFSRKMQSYMDRVAQAERRKADHAQTQVAQRFNYASKAPMIAPVKPYGMNWDGGEKYNVVGLLGKGAFATVYRLATKLDGHYYAAKELEKKRFIKNGRLDQRLDNEMQIMKSIRHDNVVQYIDCQDHADHLYIIMEYVPYGDLQHYLAANEVLTEDEAKRMSHQTLDALHYLHAKQITHRDIKPDNILLASSEPFVVKLSDFGLSKVVNTNETFLKTFCGTLLYCAPEVFPQYEEHVTPKGVKRRRSSNGQGRFHSYSHSVDVWSYGAVLWYSLCQKPPFEGVVDNTGRGMFNKIMETCLDVNPLIAHGVSQEAIDILCRMLNTDPSKRPTERECLASPWLFDGRPLPAPIKATHGLDGIAEEEEETVNVEVQAKAFSQLSVRELPITAGATGKMPHVVEYEEQPEEEVQFDSADFDFLDPRQSKRIKADLLVPHHHIRNQAATSSPSPKYPLPGGGEVEENAIPIPGRQQTRPPRFFGEIGESALQSSRVLGAHTHAALAIENTDFTHFEDSMTLDESEASYQGRPSSKLYRSDLNYINHSSLVDADLGLRDMNMMELPSPEPDNSGDVSDVPSNGPQTPKTPDVFSQQSHNTKSPPSHAKRPSQNATPMQNKLIDHQSAALEATMKLHRNTTESDISNPIAMPAVISSSDLAIIPRLGKITSTANSAFPSPIVLPLNDRVSHWGRDPGSTFVYPDKFDTRIPKRAFAIFFHAYGIEKEEREGRDWTQMPGIRTFISTISSNGIWINGVHLAMKDKNANQLCGTLYSGDVITVYQKKDIEAMSFVCEFYVGEAEARRSEELPFQPKPAIEPGSSQDRASSRTSA